MKPGHTQNGKIQISERNPMQFSLKNKQSILPLQLRKTSTCCRIHPATQFPGKHDSFYIVQKRKRKKKVKKKKKFRDCKKCCNYPGTERHDQEGDKVLLVLRIKRPPWRFENVTFGKKEWAHGCTMRNGIATGVRISPVNFVSISHERGSQSHSKRTPLDI